MVKPFTDSQAEPWVHGFRYRPSNANGDGFVLTHGAGSNCQSKVLVQVSTALAESGYEVLCIDLPFRQARPHGPPFPNSAKKDRDGIRRAIGAVRSLVPGRVFAGGHSYGGRQTTILIADEPELVGGMLLLSYPLHPPKKQSELRTEHFPRLRVPALFVHGTRDPFGSIPEMNLALTLIPSQHALAEVEGAGHDLRKNLNGTEIFGEIIQRFRSFMNDGRQDRG